MTATPAQISARELRARTPHEGKNGGHQKTRGFSHARLLIHAAGREHGPAEPHCSARAAALQQTHCPEFCQARSSATKTASFAGFRFEGCPLGLIERRFFGKNRAKSFAPQPIRQYHIFGPRPVRVGVGSLSASGRPSFSRRHSPTPRS